MRSFTKNLPLILITWVVLFVVPLHVLHAQTPTANSKPQFGDFETTGSDIIFGGTSIDALACKDNALTNAIGKIINYITAGIVVISLIMIVIAGYVYMTAGGSAERVGTAKSILGSSLVAIVIALTAFLVLNTISPQFADNVKDPTIPGAQKNPCDN